MYGIKHDLTPESKLSAQVTAKRLATHDQPGEYTRSDNKLSHTPA